MSGSPKASSPLAAGTKTGKPGTPGSPGKPGPGGKGGPKGKVGPAASAKVVSVLLDADTAKTLLTGLALALSGSVNKGKKKDNKKATGKGPKGPGGGK